MDQYGGGYPHIHYPPYVPGGRPPFPVVANSPTGLHALPPHLRPNSVPNFPPTSYRPLLSPNFPVAYQPPSLVHTPPSQLQTQSAQSQPLSQQTLLPVDTKATVYVGKIAPTVEDEFIRKLLEKCGTVSNWKRVADPVTGGLSSFGFCDFANADGAIRALLLLNNASLDGQRLLLKVNEKTQKQLDEHKKLQLEDIANQETTKESDEEIKKEILQTLQERSKGRFPNNGEEEDQDTELNMISRELKIVRERQAQKEAEKKDDEKERERELRKEKERERTRIREQREREREREARRKEREEREFKEREREWELRERERDKERERREKVDIDHVEDLDERKRRQRARERKREREEDDYDREKEAEELRLQLALQQKQELEQEQHQQRIQKKIQLEEQQKLTTSLTGVPHLFSPLATTNDKTVGFGLAAAAASLVKRRKLANISIGQVVEEEEEPDPLVPRKKRTLVTLENETASHDALDSSSSSSSSSSTSNEPKLSSAEVKKIIESIPIDKDALFAYEIDWAIVDQYGIVDSKMKSWVRSKVIEYLGKGSDVDEIAKELVDFIVSTLKGHGTANDLLSQVSNVFDDEGVFLAKMWRKLIFEILSIQHLVTVSSVVDTATTDPPVSSSISSPLES